MSSMVDDVKNKALELGKITVEKGQLLGETANQKFKETFLDEEEPFVEKVKYFVAGIDIKLMGSYKEIETFEKEFAKEKLNEKLNEKSA